MTVLILGSGSDIGEALAYKFAKEDNDIILASRNPEKMKPLMSDIQIRFNVRVDNLEFDTLKTQTHAGFVKTLTSLPDVVISVFGYLGDQELAQSDFDEASKIINTNFTGAVSILNLFAQAMEERNSGCIIGISSVAGERGRQSNYFYGSAKAGFSAFLDGMRHRLIKSGVHVMTVKPGFMRTKMTEGLDLNPRLTAEPDYVAEKIFKAYNKKKNSLYVSPIWKWIMLIIRNIPERIFLKTKL
jgi:short-subunit dehydrogenase